MNLFLCSHFSKVGALLKDHIAGKRVAFIPTASIHEGYTGYVGSQIWNYALSTMHKFLVSMMEYGS